MGGDGGRWGEMGGGGRRWEEMGGDGRRWEEMGGDERRWEVRTWKEEKCIVEHLLRIVLIERVVGRRTEPIRNPLARLLVARDAPHQHGPDARTHEESVRVLRQHALCGRASGCEQRGGRVSASAHATGKSRVRSVGGAWASLRRASWSICTIPRSEVSTRDLVASSWRSLTFSSGGNRESKCATISERSDVDIPTTAVAAKGSRKRCT
jgi:hypothetical protein